MKKVTLGKKIEKIERGAFDNSGVETITFNENLKSLEGFNNTKVKELTLPQKTRKICLPLIALKLLSCFFLRH
nr:leucine-rich repeat protein [Mycoplasmopsis bovis]